jgi:DNA-binding response OmpR family regulator
LAKVMIVDDDHTMVKLLQTLLELDGFDVSVARQGGDVINVATESKPDILLMDYHLTDTTGVEVLKKLRASTEFATIPVVIASGMNVEDEVIAAGANAFLTKPFEPDELPILFNRLIG